MTYFSDIPLSVIVSVSNSAALDKPLDFNIVTPNRTYHLRAASLVIRFIKSLEIIIY